MSATTNDQSLIQQGDVLFFLVDELPVGLKPKKGVHAGLTTFAAGTATGHHHSCDAGAAELFEDDAGALWCRVKSTTEVRHQEHKPVTLAPGNYRIGIVREYDPFADEIRAVAD